MRPTAFKLTAIILAFVGFSQFSNAQTQGDVINTVTTAVPFLRITPDARSGGMGELGVAISPDANSAFWNMGKVAFNTNKGAVSASYTPWLKDILNDVYHATVAGYYKLDEQSAISSSLRYFSLGTIQFTDNLGNDLNTYRPREIAFDFGYSRKLSEKSGLGVALRYINSNLASGTPGAGNTYKAASTVAADLGYYYSGHDDMGTGWAFGAALTNLGGKISYTDNADQKDYIPANLAFGTTYSKAFDAQNKVSFGLDVNKLLVPTPPADPATPEQLEAYRSKSVVSSWFTSFSDAPGGMSEELKEFYFSVGGEYWYNNQFALRTGYFYENKTKGNRQYFTMGVGIKYQSFGLDFSYLIPSGSGVDRNPLSNTLRFSLHFNFDGSGGATTTN